MVTPAIVTQMMPFVGRNIQAMAAAASAALSRGGAEVGSLSCEPPAAGAWLEVELDGLDPSFTSLPSRKSFSLLSSQHWSLSTKFSWAHTQARGHRPEHSSADRC
jgi:hypothetical protein